MKTKTYTDKTRLLTIGKSLSQTFIIGILSLLFSHQSNAQKLGNSFAFESNTSVVYDQSSASATITFIWKEDNGTCKTANTLRWLDLFMKDPNGNTIPYQNGNRVMTIIKRAKSNELMFDDCNGIGTYFGYGCNHMDYCFLASNGAASDTFEDDVAGTGNTQKIRIVLKNLPNSTFGQELEFRFYGWVDYDGVTGDSDDGSYFPSGRGFSFDFNKKAPGGVMQGISNPTLSVSQGACSDAELSWNAVTGPNNAGTVSYSLYKNGAYLNSTTNTSYLDPSFFNRQDRFLPGEQAVYSISTRWTPTGATEREAVTEPSDPVTFTNALYNGKITVTVQTDGNIVLPGQDVDMLFESQSSSAVCNYVPDADYNRSGVTNEFGKFEFDNLWYGHPDDTPSSWYVRLLDADGDVIAQELVSLDDENNIKTLTLVDPNAYIINGKVTTEMTCGLDGAIISAVKVGDLNIPVTPVETENDGTYSLVIPGPGTYDLTATKETNQEMHESTETIMTTNRITENADIDYTHDNILHGFVGGDCDVFWGSATVKAYSAATECFLKQTTTDGTGQYSFSVPAHDIILKVDDFNPTSGPRAK